MLPSKVQITEVGPRDGLQNEATPVSTTTKIALIQQLQAVGLKHIEVTSFVSPKWVPQMADAAQVLQGIQRLPDVCYSVLTPNWQGFQAATALSNHHPHEIVVFAAASPTFSQRNINCSIEASLERFAPVVQAARALGLKVRGSISVAVGCPYEGDVSPDAVENVARQLKSIGVQHCGLADTIGVGTPPQVQAAMARVLKHFALDNVSGHFHDTYGLALGNIYACLQMGVHIFDSSVAGLGGCPYAQGASGNVATEDVVYFLRRLGLETGVDLTKLLNTVTFISQALGRAPASRMGQLHGKHAK
jgi:hydroxymethylglutaryl-CoA lyase